MDAPVGVDDEEVAGLEHEGRVVRLDEGREGVERRLGLVVEAGRELGVEREGGVVGSPVSTRIGGRNRASTPPPKDSSARVWNRGSASTWR